jgi:hypothetical protein
MPSMDTACFLGDDTARVNFISISTIEKYDFERAKARAVSFLE